MATLVRRQDNKFEQIAKCENEQKVTGAFVLSDSEISTIDVRDREYSTYVPQTPT